MGVTKGEVLRGMGIALSVAVAVASIAIYVVANIYAPATPPPQQRARRAVWIDTDSASDDLFSVALLASSSSHQKWPKSTEVAGMSTVRGVLSAADGYRMWSSAIEQLGADTPVFAGDMKLVCGEDRPLAGDYHFPSEWGEEMLQLYAKYFPSLSSSPTPSECSGEAAAADMLSTLHSYDQLHIIAVGPLTNVALFLHRVHTSDRERGTDYMSRISLTVMGAAINRTEPDEGAPPSPSQAAEWNWYADPLAANISVAHFTHTSVAHLVPTDLTFLIHCPDVDRYGMIERYDYASNVTPSQSWQEVGKQVYSFLCRPITAELSLSLLYDGVAAIVFLQPDAGSGPRLPLQVGSGDGSFPPAGVTVEVREGGGEESGAGQASPLSPSHPCSPLPTVYGGELDSSCSQYGYAHFLNEWRAEVGTKLMHDLLSSSFPPSP
uniref:Inosine/uridine-preferring nucleoside hydrolase domain-containing protein n=1 Tax=Palpitomonas bilix TaxID=652834 RepID=A0A7S3LWI9_9EUKA|mmetsp:Transcript_6733/g.16898  ORF Transcript_6733/g.16898 Transcript_6733/m.16898 type:complete len:436 (+) Transcript_6733:204-1511(+)